jgi:hypothetical protein
VKEIKSGMAAFSTRQRQALFGYVRDEFMKMLD